MPKTRYRDFSRRIRLLAQQLHVTTHLFQRVAFCNQEPHQNVHREHREEKCLAHPGRQPFETIELAYGAQTLWPDHCVQDTVGAAFHPRVHLPRAEMVVRKGFRREIDSYSAFCENDRRTTTGLAGYLRERGFERVFLAGLATDFCVHYSAVDARRAGFGVVVIEDGCRAIDLDGSLAAALRQMHAAGVERVTSDMIAS